ncbi:hypothetical protein [Albirhodobacter sp. R86504]|uniref:hypothetical protein n=1 Tax=Albirhodobacter sp. R86504 TaxID=3093848 RepID=UPI003671BB4A
MIEANSIEKKEHRKTKRLSRVKERIQHIKDAANSLKKAPILSLLIAGVMSAVVFLIEQVGSSFYDAYKPDILRSEAEALNDSLLAKSESIDKSVKEITDLIKAIDSGDTMDTALLKGEMEKLLEGINGIKPDLSEVVSMRRDLFLVAARQKTHDISVAGMSPNADAVIRMNDGVTICDERYTVAISNSGNPDTTNPYVGLTSPSGEFSRDVNMRIGDSIQIDDDFGRVTVAYMRSEELSGERLYGFNYTCPS